MTALNFGKQNDFHSDKLVLQTTTLMTFYNSKNVEKKKEVTNYNDHNKETLELRYDENEVLKQRLIRTYDSSGLKSIARRLENYHPLLGQTSETAYHSYDSNGILNKVIEKDQNGKIIRQTEIVNNDKGYPIQLMLFLGNELYGKETAEYNYETNEVKITYFDKNDNIVSSEKSKIEFAESQPGDITNEFGDVVKSAKYEMVIKYDKYGNWIKKTYFELINEKLVKKSEFIRNIKYRKTI
ncbi:MAG: hypothetical protein CMP76_14745 [Flavobacterium sp.]|nr:hypothetical protein [Flavobacterium sp.]|tara:strand:+ start:650 stop:1369 length:720 start_codon:yes stop_codon:yes gene_type:complete